MQRVTLVRYTAKPDRAAENETLARAVFAELRAASPDHLAYALFRDGQDFVHLFVNTAADDSDALTELPSFKAFAKDVGRALRGAAAGDAARPSSLGVLRPDAGHGAGLSKEQGWRSRPFLVAGADEPLCP